MPIKVIESRAALPVSESVLTAEWDSVEEDEAWQDL
jgi:hypothetical protein